MSGSFVLRSGVGTQMLIVSSVLTTEKSVVASNFPARVSVSTSCVETSGMYDWPFDRPDLSIVEVDSRDLEANFRKFDSEWKPDVSEPDDADVRLSSLDFLQQIAPRSDSCPLHLSPEDIRSVSDGMAPAEEPGQSLPESQVAAGRVRPGGSGGELDATSGAGPSGVLVGASAAAAGTLHS